MAEIRWPEAIKPRNGVRSLDDRLCEGRLALPDFPEMDDHDPHSGFIARALDWSSGACPPSLHARLCEAYGPGVSRIRNRMPKARHKIVVRIQENRTAMSRPVP
jgi:hypothetical protein